jgi:hypothetical protein
MEAREKMTKYKEVIFNLETGETTERPFTKEEIAQMEANIAKEALELEAQTKKLADKAALLAKLGISPDEAKLLLA